jgi:YD repeat-containing protein
MQWANRLTSVTTPDNQVITFDYDNANRRGPAIRTHPESARVPCGLW